MAQIITREESEIAQNENLLQGVQKGLLSERMILILLGAIIFASYLFGLMVPLMDHDSAHHANIALRMFLTGDYTHLIDKGNPYLDKPHLLFWTSALSYHIFGVNAFAYKFPSFLFSLLGLYSTYRLGKLLYNKTVGIYATLILSTAFAFSLSNSDVRMDAILSACMVFSAWQLIAYYHKRKLKNLVLTALGLALAFSTKGMIGPAVPVIAMFWFLIFKKDLKFLLNPKLYLIIPLFFLFICPVLYAYYVQFDLHPELVIRGIDGRSGVKFILWDQSFERYDGVSFGGAGHKDYFFFLHSALWAFLPWAALFYIAYFTSFYKKIKKIDKAEFMNIGTVGFLLLIYSFAGFKLPHYLNTLFSFMAIITATLLVKDRPIKILIKAQVVINIILILTVVFINLFLFPMNVWLLAIIILVYVIGTIAIYKTFSSARKILLFTVLTGALTNLVLQGNFYPKLLKYQGGTGLLNSLEDKNMDIPVEKMFYYNYQSFSYDFGKAYLHGHFYDDKDIVLKVEEGPIYIYTHDEGKSQLESRTELNVETVITQRAFHVTRLNYKFLNPSTREESLNNHFLLKVEKL